MNRQWLGNMSYRNRADPPRPPSLVPVQASAMQSSASPADLSRVRLVDADLTGVVLSDADLSQANLAGADLTRADLAGGIPIGTRLVDADLIEANLTGVDLTGTDLAGARFPARCRWPRDGPELHPPDSCNGKPEPRNAGKARAA